ncbi:MAG: response regulator [Planctomycetota bacterium]
MITESVELAAKSAPCLLLVEPSPDVARALTEWLREREVVVVHAASAREAALAISDAVFIESGFAGLLVDVNLPDATGYRVMSAFRDEFPGRLVAAMTGSDDLCLKMWCKARRIPVFRQPVGLEEVALWAGKVKESMHPLEKQAARRAKPSRDSYGAMRKYALGF